MRALIQRVTEASVSVNGQCIGAIDQGLLVLLAVQKADTEEQAQRLLDKVLNYRVFADQQNKMNLSLAQVGAKLLVVSQFTLAADTGKGLRPGFSSAAAPDQARALYQYFIDCARAKGVTTETGEFAADMAVQLVNDGPVTFLLEVGSPAAGV